MNKQELFDTEMGRAKTFFENNTKNGKKCFYRLYASKYPHANPSQKNIKASNFEAEDVEQALHYLQNDFVLHGQLSPNYWIVKLLQSKTDPNGLIIVLNNALCEDVGFRPTATIAGISGNDSKQYQEQLLKLQQDMFNKTAELEKMLIEERHDRELERLEGRIQGLEDSKKTLMDTLSNFSNSETGKMIVSGLVGIVTAKVTQTNNSCPPTAQPQTVMDSEPVSDAATDNIEVNQSIKDMQQMFGADFHDVMKGLADFCKANPQYAQTLMQQQKNK